MPDRTPLIPEPDLPFDISTGRVVEVQRSRHLKACAEVVWDRICGPLALADWHPRIAGCTRLDDQTGLLARVLELVGEEGAPVVRMTEWEYARVHATMTIVYTVDISGLPISHYHARMTVTPEGQGCVAALSSRFLAHDTDEPSFDAEELVANFYDIGLAHLAELTEDR